MRRTYWLLIITIPALLIAGDIAYWRFVTQKLRLGYENWIAARSAEGWRSESGSLSVGGWPRAATVAIPNLTLRHQGPAVPGNLVVAATAVTLSVSLFNPDSLRISFAGATRVQVADMPDVAFTSDDNVMAVPLQQDRSYAIDLHASNLRIAPGIAPGTGTGAWQAAAGLLNAHAIITQPTETEDGGAGAEPAEPPVRFSANAETISLPAVVRWPLGTTISSVSLDGQLNGRLPRLQGLPASDLAHWNHWAEAWRDGGGSLAITHLAMGWGPLGLTSSATLALDEQLQPMGSGNGRFVGYAAALDKLAAGGTLTKSAATAAKAVLSLMAESTEANEPSAVDVPLTLQYRTLSMRQVPLVRLPELDWPSQ